MKRFISILSMLFVCVIILGFGCQKQGVEVPLAVVGVDNNVLSFDGVPIAYTIYGTGDVTLLFVHGWSCDSRYWREQVSYFDKQYRVITMDLAGHGHSGLSRSDYTMESFGQDVTAVIKDVDAQRVILVGHSMGGAVIVQAALMNPDRVIGIIGVDTLHNVEEKMSDETKDAFMQPLRDDFANNAGAMVRTMFHESVDPLLVDWVAQDMASAPSFVALSAVQHYLENEPASMIQQLTVPVRCVNAELWPTDVEKNKQYASSFEVTVIPNTGHFLMLAVPQQFNEALEQVVQGIIGEK